MANATTHEISFGEEGEGESQINLLGRQTPFFSILIYGI